VTKRLLLGSSVDYWRRALRRENGLSVREGPPHPGDIAVYGPHRDPLLGGGDDGHTGVVYQVLGNMVICIESRGHVGVCFMARQLNWWSDYIAVEGMDEHILAAMGVWEHMYDHLTGTVHRVGYFSGQGREIIEDDWRIDCSGCVYLVVNYGFEHAVAIDIPKPPPIIHYTNEDEEDGVFWYAPDGTFHYLHVDPATGHLLHDWVLGHEDLSARYGSNTKLDPAVPLKVGVNPNSGGLCVEAWGVGFPDPNRSNKRWPVRIALEGNPYRWNFKVFDPAGIVTKAA
jgi:hypothetical protein